MEDTTTPAVGGAQEGAPNAAAQGGEETLIDITSEETTPAAQAETQVEQKPAQVEQKPAEQVAANQQGQDEDRQLEDLRVLLNSDIDREQLSRFLTYKPQDYTKFTEQQLIEIKTKGQYPHWSDDKIREYIKDKYGDNKVAFTEAAEAARQEFINLDKEFREKLEKDLAPHRETYEKNRKALEDAIATQEAIVNTFQEAISKDELSLYGVKLGKNALKSIGESLSPFFEQGSQFWAIFQDKDGKFNERAYLDAVVRYRPDLVNPKVADKIKEVQEAKLKAKYIGTAANLNTKGVGGDTTPHRAEEKKPGSVEDIQKAVKKAYESSPRGFLEIK